eukprot:ctg_17.g2
MGCLGVLLRGALSGEGAGVAVVDPQLLRGGTVCRATGGERGEQLSGALGGAPVPPGGGALPRVGDGEAGVEQPASVADAEEAAGGGDSGQVLRRQNRRVAGAQRQLEAKTQPPEAPTTTTPTAISSTFPGDIRAGAAASGGATDLRR